MIGKFGFRLWVGVTAAVISGAILSPAVAANVLRVCADPDNLPFSKAEGPERGLYVDLAGLVAERMHLQVEYVWWLSFYQTRALRNTLLAGNCDAYFALPANADYMGRSLARTRPFLDVGYAVVAPPSFSFAGLADLKSKRLAVQYGSSPQIFLAAQEGFRVTTFRTAGEVFAALAQQQVDAAFLWGPVAGYENKRRYGNAWRVTPVAGSGLDGQVAVAVRKGNDTLLASLDRALAELKPDIARLADKYGFPRTTPVILETSVAPSPTLKAAAGENQASIPAGNGDAVSAARETFNNHCSHCHAPNAMSPVRERDLRRLKLRYGDKWREVAATAIKNGRPENGMPPWKDLLDDKRIGLLLSFFETIQREP